jgi:NADH dehydrogenase [ubiquinone] 1 alpha subcomplex assembly factor 7
VTDGGAKLGAIIDAQISNDGPMPLSTYMTLCLSHPQFGYYRTRDPLGRGGDFTTAPEISQMFGEMIGAFVAGCWQTLGRPRIFDLVELGPGRGTLMADMLRVASGFHGFDEGLRPILIETSEPLIAAQRQTLAGQHPEWRGSIDDIDEDGPPLVVIANEFFDALPIRQVQRTATGWHERVVGLRDGRRVFGLAPDPLPDNAIPQTLRASQEGAIWEIGSAACNAARTLAARLAGRAGVALIIDYGHAETTTGDTFQAVAHHDYVDPLQSPGDADLTAHVDFAALAGAAAEGGAIVREPVTQAQFLAAMGIISRARALGAANPQLAESITADLKRLTGRDGMGTLFRVLCLSSGGLAPYPFAET